MKMYEEPQHLCTLLHPRLGSQVAVILHTFRCLSSRSPLIQYPFTFLAPVVATYESPLYPSVELHTEAMLNEIPEIDAATYNRGFATMSSFL